jgi:hypothetical protein
MCSGLCAGTFELGSLLKMNRKSLYLILLLVPFTAFLWLVNDIAILSRVYFFCALAYVFWSIAKSKSIRLIDVWNVSFIFVIVSEALMKNAGDQEFLIATQFLMTANNLVNIGYLSAFKKSRLDAGGLMSPPPRRRMRYQSLTLFVLLSCIVGYALANYQAALLAASIGRSTAADILRTSSEARILDALWSAIGMVIPSILTYYVLVIKNGRLIYALALAAPILLIQMISGTRFVLLFSMIGIIVVYMSANDRRWSWRKLLTAICLMLGLLYSTVIMKEIRSGGSHFPAIVAGGVGDMTWLAEPNLAKFAEEFLSPEGVIDMTALMFRYFDTHPHLYGLSTSYLLYFWVPRSIWEEKPTMLGHWLIREYRSGFSEGHSVSFGFIGDLYADFGLFSLIAIFMLGSGLFSLELFRRKMNANKGLGVVFGAMLYPYVFFFVRSPITSTINIFAIYLIYFVFRRLMEGTK